MSLTTRVWKVKGWGDHQQGARTGRGMGLDEWRIPSEQKNLNHNLHSLLTMALRRRQLLILITSLNDS